MVVVYVQSFIPYVHVNSEYYFEDRLTIEQFCSLLEIKWDEDALIVINKVICNDKSTILNDGDQIKLLIPISGG